MGMNLIVDDWKTFIGKKENRFELLQGEKKTEFSADDVNQIIVVAASSISVGAVRLALEKGIDIVFINRFGAPTGRIYPCKLGGTTFTRKRQLEAYFSGKGLELAKNFISGKVKNQATVLKALQKTRANVDFAEQIEKMNAGLSQIGEINGGLDDVREKLLGIEGNAASEYFQALSEILPFEKRDRKSGDIFNTMLNYAYGILYSEVEKACILAGLDPYLGYLHTDRYGKPSMVLDLIEEFRAPIADKAVITLIARKQVEDKDIEKNGETVLLSESGRKKVIEAVMARLHGTEEQTNAEKRLKNAIVEQARAVARFVLGSAERYQPYGLVG
ncbi:MAG: CRISPR-associated endonuclease Cas1 [Candidatus Hadarchaeota archaeon]